MSIDFDSILDEEQYTATDIKRDGNTLQDGIGAYSLPRSCLVCTVDHFDSEWWFML